MPDPRHVLGAADCVMPDVDLAEVHTRARQLRRRRSGAALAGAAVLVVTVSGALLVLPGQSGSEQLVPPLASGRPTTPTPAPAPATPSPRPSGTAPVRPLPPSTPAPPSTSSAHSPSTSSVRPPNPPLQASAAPTQTPRTTARPAPPTTPPATSSPGVPFLADDLPEAAGGTGGTALVLTGITTGRQTGYDRVVYQFAGPKGSSPGWRVGYVDRPVQESSGDPVQLAGSAYLQVFLLGMSNDVPAGTTEYTGRQSSSGSLLREVVTTGTFEGESQSFLGLAERVPFRVFRLADPTRVVVDVRTR